MNVTDVRVIPDVDRWKLVISSKDKSFGVIILKQDDLAFVAHTLLDLVRKIDDALPDRATELRNEADRAGASYATDEAIPGVVDDISELWEE